MGSLTQGSFFSKRCPNCGAEKKFEEFPKNRASKDGLAAYCKPCHNIRMKEISDRLYGGHRNFLFRLRYGIELSEVEAMISRQGGKCAICRRNSAKHLDHDHVSGQVRAVLCFDCNRGLGKFQDNLKLLTKALAYLELSNDQRRFW